MLLATRKQRETVDLTTIKRLLLDINFRLVRCAHAIMRQQLNGSDSVCSSSQSACFITTTWQGGSTEGVSCRPLCNRRSRQPQSLSYNSRSASLVPSPRTRLVRESLLSPPSRRLFPTAGFSAVYKTVRLVKLCRLICLCTYVRGFSQPHTHAIIREGGGWQNSIRFLDMASCLISMLAVFVLQTSAC